MTYQMQRLHSVEDPDTRLKLITFYAVHDTGLVDEQGNARRYLVLNEHDVREQGVDRTLAAGARVVSLEIDPERFIASPKMRQ